MPFSSDECKRLLGWVGLGDKEFNHFVRATSFRKETTKKDFEAHKMPSLAALDRHSMLYMAYSALLVSVYHFNHMGGPSIVLVDWGWQTNLTGTDKGCSCKRSKYTLTCKCKANKKPCSIKMFL